MIIRGIFQTLSKMYHGPFPTEPCVTLACSELETYAEPTIYLLWGILFRTMCNSSIFRTLAYSEFKAYSSKCQTPIMKYFIQKPCLTLTYSEPSSILTTRLKSRRINTLSNI